MYRFVLSSVCMRRRTEPRNAGLWFRADCAGLTAWSNRRGTSGTVGGIPHREPWQTRSPIPLIGWNENGLIFSRKLLIGAVVALRHIRKTSLLAGMNKRRCVSADQAGSSKREVEEGLGGAERIKSGRSSGVGDDVFTALS
jgi:hypothetical protein